MKREEIELGGMFQSAVEAPERAHRVVNMRRDPEGYWAEVPGAWPYANLSAGAVVSLAWFVPRPNIRHLVLEQVSDATTAAIRTVNAHSSTATTLFERRRLASGDLGTLFLQDGRWLYLVSPTGAPVRWDGQRLRPVGWISPVPPPSVAGPDQGWIKVDRAGATLTGAPVYLLPTKQRGVGVFPDSADTFWRYGYALQAEDELGNLSPPSAMAFASGNNDSTAFGRYTVKLRIPRMSAPAVAVHVLRTTNLHGVTDPAAATLYFHSRIPHAGGCDLIDHSPEGELGLPIDPDAYGPTPIGPRAAAFWQGSLWLNDASTGSRLYYSVPGKPGQFPAINFVDAGSTATGPIVALQVAPRGLFVFKQHAVYVVKGNPVEGYRIETISERRGCAAPRAVEVVPGLGVLFLSAEGPALIAGTLDDDRETLIRELPGIRRTWRRLVGPALQTAVSVYDPEHHEVWWHVPRGGEPAPSLGLVLHTDLLAWSLREGWPVSSFARHRGRVWMGSNDDDNPGVLVQTGYLQTGIDGSTITASYTTGNYATHTVSTVKTVNVGLVARGEGSTFDVQTRNDRGDLSLQTEGARTQRHTQIDRDRWGTAQWDTGTWGDYASTVVPVDLYQASGLQHQIRVSASRIALWGLELLVDGGTRDEPLRRS